MRECRGQAFGIFEINEYLIGVIPPIFHKFFLLHVQRKCICWNVTKWVTVIWFGTRAVTGNFQTFFMKVNERPWSWVSRRKTVKSRESFQAYYDEGRMNTCIERDCNRSDMQLQRIVPTFPSFLFLFLLIIFSGGHWSKAFCASV